MGPGSSFAAAAAVVSAAVSWLASCWKAASQVAGEARDLVELCKGLVPPCPACSLPPVLAEPSRDSASWLLVGLVVGLVIGLLLGGLAGYLGAVRSAVSSRPVAAVSSDWGRGAGAVGDGAVVEPDDTDWVPKRASRPGRCLA